MKQQALSVDAQRALCLCIARAKSLAAVTDADAIKLRSSAVLGLDGVLIAGENIFDSAS
jgi:hypothetical protein